jgi:hypothetical protein
MKLYKGTVRKSAGGGGFRHHQSRRMSNCTQRRAIRQSGGCSHRTAVYVVELSLKLSPMPVSVQRKELADAQALYSQIMAVLESGHPRVLELSCEKAEEKRVSLLSSFTNVRPRVAPAPNVLASALTVDQLATRPHQHRILRPGSSPGGGGPGVSLAQRQPCP